MRNVASRERPANRIRQFGFGETQGETEGETMKAKNENTAAAAAWPTIEIPNASEHQLEQFALATSGPIGCLTGGGGVGKTFVTMAAVRSLRSQRVGVVAPTGKAAVRSTELLRAAGIHDVAAQTIHRALGPTRDENGWHFAHNERNPLPYGVLFVDESSMIDNWLMSCLLSAVRPGCRVLFIGDPYQLPPVGAGRPFADMIESAQIPHGHLDEIWRYAGRLAHVCRAIRNRERWEPSPEIDLDETRDGGPENMRHVERRSASASIQAMHSIVERMADRGFDPIEDVQVLCAVNERSALSRVSLNERLQSQLNPSGERVDGCEYRLRDKVMCLSNGIRERCRADGSTIGSGDPDDPESQTYVANGEIGRVAQLGDKSIVIDFGTTAARFPRATWSGDLSLAYAVTTHKMQGSGSPVAIPMIDDYAGARLVCSREFHYTGLSRAEKLCVSIGRRDVIDRDCQRSGIARRQTNLQREIVDARRRMSGGKAVTS